MIRFEAVTKRFSAHIALDGVSFEVPRGALAALLGRSGSGKSTLLRLTNRLIGPDAGRVTVNDMDVATMDPVTLRRRIGYVIQSVGLFPHWSVADNVATVPRLLGWERARVAARVEAMLHLVGLPPETYAARRPAQLSGGQQQRVGVARALAADPDLLLMDEPFGALDPETRATMQAELRRIHVETGKTILLVTHDADEALRLADHIVVLETGRVLQAGETSALLGMAGGPLAGFVGEDRALRHRLAGMPIAPLFRAADPAAAPTVRHDASAAEALSLMLGARSTRLAVVDDAGRTIGSLDVADLVRRGR